LIGLYYVEQWKQPDDELSIFSDSQLLVRHIHGIYKVRNAALMLKHKIAVHWIKALQATIHHVPREENSQADSMANKGIDLKKAVPAQFTTRLRAYEVTVR
jgi:ribonuclease HI